MNREKKLQVKDLTISFRTVNGKVQAVRDISFDLYKGETLAIVGESGSGKSVTSKAILGISANNAMVEGGEILYDGKDLLKIGEEDFHAIRGDKIAMVFQDPLSSLNPIMRVGRQLTEAMLLKNRANRRECRRAFNAAIRRLDECITQAGAGQNKNRFDRFRRVIRFQSRYQGPYDAAYSSATAALKTAEDLLIGLSRDATDNLAEECRELRREALASADRFVVYERAAELKALAGRLPAQGREAKNGRPEALRRTVEGLRDILAEAVQGEKPDFFALGIWLESGRPLPAGDAGQVNAVTAEALRGEFITDFRAKTEEGVAYSFRQALEGKKKVLETIRQYRPVFEKTELVRSETDKAAEEICRAVEESIDRLEPVKDSLAWTFKVSLNSALGAWYSAGRRNRQEEKRYQAQSRKYERLAARGRAFDWKVAPLSLVDRERLRRNVLEILDNLAGHYERAVAAGDAPDVTARGQALMDWFREMALGEIHRVTRSMAKDAALRLMESVGIPEPRKRYRQYPFEFSGGMRQRIVIAISLTADPDILICDEPTTALDVTIQAQILELINDLKKQRNLSVIFITHDLGVVANMADRIAVMYAGKIVEYGTAEDVFYSPAHPYTWALLSSVPDLDTSERLESIPGTPPNMIYPPKGDAFAPRNKYAMEIDFEQQPPMFRISDTHYAATWLLHPDAPRVEPPRIVQDRIRRMTGKRGDGHAEA